MDMKESSITPEPRKANPSCSPSIEFISLIMFDHRSLESKKVSNEKMKNFFSYNLKFPTYVEGLNFIKDNFV